MRDINRKWLEAHGLAARIDGDGSRLSRTVCTPQCSWDASNDAEYLKVSVEYCCTLYIDKYSVEGEKVSRLTLLEAQVYDQEMLCTLANMYLEIESCDFRFKEE